MTTQELAGIAHELKFWQGFVKTERFLKGWVENRVTPELNHKVYDFIHGMLTQAPFRDQVKILDVGSGVVSILNGLVPQKNLTAVDPLGGLYELIFEYKRYGIKPPVPMPAEELAALNESYDIVHISNALDHCQNPALAYLSLGKMVKPGGFLIIQGFENEGNYENWQGFHQWNIELDTQRQMLVLSNKDGMHAEWMGAHLCFRTEFENNKSWFVWIVKK